MMQHQTSSSSHTATLNPVNSQPSSVSTPQIGISTLPLRGNISEPEIPTIDHSITYEKELARPITQAEAFKATHTRKKKTPKDPDVWVEPRAQLTYNLYLQCIENFHQTLPEDGQDLPLSQEQNERILLDIVGGPSRYGYAYGFPQRTFLEFHLELEGLSSFQDDESRETILALKQQIAELSIEAEASRASKGK
ncbi:uncharacterized protein LOC107860852 [Capsicum annuum]|uniref:uncharacterized protein LOC107860852 n=1 Tax=Capsicum annuum TaxID=4072 RepID=UPI001FB07073|nr:uncharacterized protein LOC107860852 [Capsicum annuum]